MKKYIYLFLSTIALVLTSACQDIVEGINENPNDLIIDDIEPKLFLTGGMLANVQIQCGHLNRISGMYTGQLIGFSSLYSNIYGYNISTVESNSEWNALYVGVLTNMRHIAANSTSNQLVGIAKIVEAHAVGTSASLYGGIPYSEAVNPEISDPVFDSQISVYDAAIALLDEGISTLGSASSGSLDEDIYFDGDTAKWIAAAYTLKARFLLHKKDYAGALSAAQNGISSPDGDMRYFPRGEASVASGDKNLFWTILEGSRAGDIGNSVDGTQSFLLDLLDASTAVSRNNAKTNEAARLAYYTIDSSGGSGNTGIIEQFEPQNMVTYFENQLIIAEAHTRSGNLTQGLAALNVVRAWLNSGGNLNANFTGLEYLYAPYEMSDFENGGMENQDSVSTSNALLREIIEERYVSGFGMHMAFNDARRLRSADATVAVPYIMKGNDSSQKAERMPYAFIELNSNENAPDDPGIFAKTEVNQ